MRWPQRWQPYTLDLLSLLLLFLAVLGTVKAALRHPPPESLAYGSDVVVRPGDWEEMLRGRRSAQFDSLFTVTPFLTESIAGESERQTPVYTQSVRVNPAKETSITINALLDAGLYQMAFSFKDGSERLGRVKGDRGVDEGAKTVAVNFLRPFRMVHGQISPESEQLYRGDTLYFSFTLDSSLRHVLGKYLYVKLHHVMVLGEDQAREQDDKELPYAFIDLESDAKYFKGFARYSLGVEERLFEDFGGQSFFLALYATSPDPTKGQPSGVVLLATSSSFALNNYKLDIKPLERLKEHITFGLHKPPSSPKKERSTDRRLKDKSPGKESSRIIERPPNVLYRPGDVIDLRINDGTDLSGPGSLMLQRPRHDPVVIENPDVSSGKITCSTSGLVDSGTYAAQLTCQDPRGKSLLQATTSTPGIHITNHRVALPCQGDRCKLKKLDLVFDGHPSSAISSVQYYSVNLIAQGLRCDLKKEPSPLVLAQCTNIAEQFTNRYADGRVHIRLSLSGVPEELLDLNVMTIEVLVRVVYRNPGEREHVEDIKLALSDPFALCTTKRGKDGDGAMVCPASIPMDSRHRLHARRTGDGTLDLRFDLYPGNLLASTQVRRKWKEDIEMSLPYSRNGTLPEPSKYKGALVARGSTPSTSTQTKTSSKETPPSPRSDLAKHLKSIRVGDLSEKSDEKKQYVEGASPVVQASLGRNNTPRKVSGDAHAVS